MPYDSILPSGRDTSTPACLEKRIRLMTNAGLTQGRVLDAGCGAGEYLFALIQKFNIDGVGIECDEDKVESAHRSANGRMHIHQGTIENLPFNDEEFDFILFNEVIEHVPNEKTALRELFRVLRPGGKLFVFCPNRLFPLETHSVHSRRSGRRIGKFLPISWFPLSISQMLIRFEARNYWPWELRKAIEDAGFEISSTNYLWPTFENISGESPKAIKLISPLLRNLANILEHTPFLRSFGVSQVVIGQKTNSTKNPQGTQEQF